MADVINEQTHKPNTVARLTLYFGAVYILQGICQIQSLLNQPIKNYLNKGLNYSPEQTANFLFIGGLPWVIKPIYGLISDFIPLFGYRRRSYLLLLNAISAAGFIWMAGISDPTAILYAVVLVGVSVAASDVIVDAVMVQAGQETGMVRRFQGVQWICLYSAAVGSGVLGAWLIGHYTALRAVQISAIVCVIPPILVASLTLWAVHEKRAKLNLPELKASGAGLLAAFTSLRLWAVLALLCLLTANPGMWVPWYYHLANTLQLSPEFVALTDAIFSGGAVLGAGIFLAFLSKRVAMRRTLVIGILASAAGAASYLLVRGQTSAAIASFIWGVGYMIGNLAFLSLAADVCPKRAEGFVFAAMMSAMNFSQQYTDVWGSTLYERLNHNITPLIILSVGFSLIALPFVPFIPITMPEPEAVT